ncbi:MAG: lytic transglycosylase domain-containing protein [Rhodopila sp.]|nr:lytic transglycosylase domain-containing protein [Rhodopila sp.]
MNWRTIPILLALLAPCRVLADTSLALPATASQLCRQAITAAERAHGIPSHLLAAIARVESGRKDQASGTFNPWPWTIDLDGQGSFYDSKTQAVAAAVSMRVRAAKSIDVGCMQISLTHHPDAFPSMEQAFDPSANVDYAARLLVRLFEKTNSWPKAVELYHSATPELGQDYRQRVYAAWPEEQKLAEATGSYPLTNTWASTVNRSLLSLPLRQRTPHIMPQTLGLTGNATPGRTLDAYRAAPVRVAFHAL